MLIEGSNTRREVVGIYVYSDLLNGVMSVEYVV
jgi:hypothetical protein